MTAQTSTDAGNRSKLLVVSVGTLEVAVAGRVLGSSTLAGPLQPAVFYEEQEYPVLDLPRLFGTRESAEGDLLLLLVEQGELRRALVVDQLVGYCAFTPGQLLPVPQIYPQAERDRWHGLLPLPGGRIIAVPCLAGLPNVSVVNDGDSNDKRRAS